MRNFEPLESNRTLEIHASVSNARSISRMLDQLQDFDCSLTVRCDHHVAVGLPAHLGKQEVE